jgi:adenine-specific DNA methylase
MFTHQDTGVWSDMVGIFRAAGLQVVGAWYIATETTSELKKGGYVQGTVILMLRKRPAGVKSGFKQRILPAVRNEVKAQIEQMMHLNEEVKEKLGEPVFNDSDLQMAIPLPITPHEIIASHGGTETRRHGEGKTVSCITIQDAEPVQDAFHLCHMHWPAVRTRWFAASLKYLPTV